MPLRAEAGGNTEDWNLIEIEYVYGKIVKDKLTGKKSIIFPAQKDIAEKWKVSESQVANRSTKGKWILKREKYLSDFKNKIKEENLREIFINRNEKAGETLKQIDALSKLTNYYLGRYREVLNHTGGDDSFDFRDIDEEAMATLSIKDLKILSEIIEKVQKLSDEVLKIEPTSQEDIGEDVSTNKEVENTLKVLEKRMMQRDLNKRREAKIETLHEIGNEVEC